MGATMARRRMKAVKAKKAALVATKSKPTEKPAPKPGPTENGPLVGRKKG